MHLIIKISFLLQTILHNLLQNMRKIDFHMVIFFITLLQLELVRIRLFVEVGYYIQNLGLILSFRM